ncbi:MAG TPA: ABC transporter permease, partial [Cyclobacteriaceae bacterium]
YILLKQGEDPAFIRSKLSEVNNRTDRKNNGSLPFSFDMQALTGLHFWTGTGMDNPKGNETNTKILAVIAAVLLIVALFNFINLTTVISLERSKEVGVRKVAGAQRSELVRQFLGESAVAVVIAAILAFMFVVAMNSLFTTVSGKGISFNNGKDVLTIGITAALLILAAILSSIYPASVLSSYKPLRALKHEHQDIGGGGLL